MKTRSDNSRTLSYLLSLLLITAAANLAWIEASTAQERQRRGEAQGERNTAEDEGDQKEADGKLLAIVGADVYTVTGETIRRGIVLVKDGKIEAVGQDVAIPDGAERIDATGKMVTPGFIAISMSGVGVGRSPGENDRIADILNPFDRNLKYSLGVGITTGCVQLSQSGGRFRRGRDGEPEEIFEGLEIPAEELLTQTELDFGDENTSLCPCCGLPILPTEPITAARPSPITPQRHVVLKLSYGNLDDMLVQENAFYDLTPGALTGAVNRHNWRQRINAIKNPSTESNESRDSNESAAGGRGGRGGFDPRSRFQRGGGRGGRGGGSSDPELRRLVNKEIALRIQANTVDEIRDQIALARELDYRLVIVGGIEAWLVAGELSDAGVNVIYTPRQRRQAERGREETSGSSIESTGIFQESGVPFATAALSSSVSTGGIAGRDLTSLPLEAAFAVRGGASNETALKSLTIVPAKMLGLEDRIGSIEPGKDADLIILNGPPLDYRSYVETAIVAGDVVYERDADRVFPVDE